MRTPVTIDLAMLSSRLEGLGVSLSENALTDLVRYLTLLMKWNKAMNLVGTNSWQKTLDTLVVDSFHLARFIQKLPLPASPVTLDLGAGAGLPGIPLRLVWRTGRYVLVEVREKRALFMKTVLSSCNLGDTTVYHGRAEEYFASYPPVDCIISRAFMPWRELLSFINSGLVRGGHALFLTLTSAPGELPAGWTFEAEATYLVEGKNRYLWCMTKKVPI